MSKAKVVIGTGTYMAHYASGSGNEATATMKIGALSGTAADGVLGGGQSTYQIGYRNEDTSFSGLLKAKSIVKVGSGKLTLKTAGHTSPITVNEGTLELQNTSSNTLCSGLITVAKGGTLTGTATVQNVTMKQGATILCTLTASSNSRLTVKGNLTHSGDTLLVRIPSTRKLKEGDELTVFNVQGTHKGDVTVKTEAEDGTAYEFDTTNLLTDGIIRVKSVVTGIELIHNEKGSGTMFDLSGRRVQIPKRGLLIIDGKKKLVQ